jgi:hypothetical protein
MLMNWVDHSVLASIAELQFDPVNLHKLTPPEDAALFNLNLDITNHIGLIIDKDGKVSSLNSTTKMEKSLPTFSHWFSAFSVYTSIRIACDDTGTMGAALLMFMRDINNLQLTYPWLSVLQYFHELFRDYQKAPAEQWKEPHLRALSRFLRNPVSSTIHPQTKPPPPPTKQTGYPGTPSDANKKRYTPEERASQICQAYNIEDKGCKPTCPYGRRHVCLFNGCGKPHPLYRHK